MNANETMKKGRQAPPSKDDAQKTGPRSELRVMFCVTKTSSRGFHRRPDPKKLSPQNAVE